MEDIEFPQFVEPLKAAQSGLLCLFNYSSLSVLRLRCGLLVTDYMPPSLVDYSITYPCHVLAFQAEQAAKKAKRKTDKAPAPVSSTTPATAAAPGPGTGPAVTTMATESTPEVATSEAAAPAEAEAKAVTTEEEVKAKMDVAPDAEKE